MSEMNASINPNTADLEQLTLLAGVGPALAQRIIEHRPFSSLEDMQRVPGLGKSTLDKMRTIIDVETIGEPAPESSAPEDVEPVAGTPAKRGPLEMSDRAAYVSRSQVLGISAAVAGVGIVISILLMLSIFVGINRTLNYANHAAFRALATDVNQIQDQLEEIDSGMAGIETRLEALEGLSGRMTALEGETEDISSEVEAASARVQQMRTRVDEIALQIEQLVQQADQQMTFFERLQQLLTEVFGGVVEENVQ
jgi:competence ComEA-like helix-hairpin-helix protein